MELRTLQPYKPLLFNTNACKSPSPKQLSATWLVQNSSLRTAGPVSHTSEPIIVIIIVAIIIVIIIINDDY